MSMRREGPGPELMAPESSYKRNPRGWVPSDWLLGLQVRIRVRS